METRPMSIGCIRRVQRKRVKGWRMPSGTTCVTRPGKWGNPFQTADEFRFWLGTMLDNPGAIIHYPTPQLMRMNRIANDINQLRGFNLACFCKLDDACHADVLMEFANR